ncbi:MAG TPA: cyclopropane-fatty-acyl-phospholipid synthase family protein [Hyphomicrobiaceae bacterium]|nr:cyclopropane-fatty-acyl-phospholipid synthase family protein [Hyphomicrobiaceae bacterium]
MSVERNQRQLAAAKRLVRLLAAKVDLDASVRLWDGSVLPLGNDPTGPFAISIAGPGVIGSLLRRPSLDNLIRHYIDKRIDFTGGTIIDFGAQLNRNGRSINLQGVGKLELASALMPFLLMPAERPPNAHGFDGDIIGRSRRRNNKAFVQFHYDVSNDFYALFLDPEMVYSCAYFTDWSNDLAQAQRDKLEMICRKLRLKPGERFLDIGCGWGGLVCHAARHFGVTAHGITLSDEQLAYARRKVQQLGLEDRVTLELQDYAHVEGAFDKIASIGMYEHIGLANIPDYMSKVRSLLREDGLFLNHAIARRARRPSWWRRRLRPEQKAIAKYIFPGGELDDVGHSIAAMERAGFEVHDVEGWRMHYARTCKMWCEKLTAERERAIALVGEEKFRIWTAYLGGVSLAFSRGTLRIYQTLASKSAKRPAPLPPTRADLYH